MLAWAKPTRFVTLTQAPDGWQALRMKVRRLAHELRHDGYRVQWAWTVEQGSKTGMRHVHLLQHGDFIPQGVLQEAWGHIVHIEAIKGGRGAAAYAMKEAARVSAYAMKESRADFLAHLDRNGGRACHLSRGYLRGLRTREVEALLWPPDPGLTWFLVPASESEGNVRALAAAVAVVTGERPKGAASADAA